MAAAILAISIQALLGAPASTQEPAHSKTTYGFPNHDGSFSAMMMFLPESQVSEFDKPEDQGPRITPLHKIGPGTKVAIKILFDNPERNEGGAVDVTYDIKVIRPDGTTLEGTNHRNLVAVRATVPITSGVFDNRSPVLTLQFDEDDPIGIYKATASLHDNVADRHVPLTAEIVLTK